MVMLMFSPWPAKALIMNACFAIWRAPIGPGLVMFMFASAALAPKVAKIMFAHGPAKALMRRAVVCLSWFAPIGFGMVMFMRALVPMAPKLA